MARAGVEKFPARRLLLSSWLWHLMFGAVPFEPRGSHRSLLRVTEDVLERKGIWLSQLLISQDGQDVSPCLEKVSTLFNVCETWKYQDMRIILMRTFTTGQSERTGIYA